LLFELLRDGVHFRLRLLARHAGLEAGYNRSIIVSAAVHHLVVHPNPEGREQLRAFRSDKVAWQYADDGEHLGIQGQRFSHGVRRASEAPLPQAVAQDHHRLGSLLFFLGHKLAAPNRFHAQRMQKVGGNCAAADVLRFVDAGEIKVPGLKCRHLRENVVQPSPVEVVGVGNGDVRLPWVCLTQHHQPARIAERQRLEQHGVHHTKDCGIGPDAERQRNHRDRGEARRLD